MRTYKGFTEDLKATYGNGIFQYEPGKTYREEKSKTRSTGFHAAEYLPDCMMWYGLNDKSRFFLCESGGSIDEEDGCSMVVSTELTLIKELDLLDIAGHTMMYMVEHPQRKWISMVGGVMITSDAAHTGAGRLLAIARGERPIVYGIEGTAVGWILESEGNIIAAKVGIVGQAGIEPGVKYTITANLELVEVQDETESNCEDRTSKDQEKRAYRDSPDIRRYCNH